MSSQKKVNSNLRIIGDITANNVISIDIVEPINVSSSCNILLTNYNK
jgi:hypothetical protein